MPEQNEKQLLHVAIDDAEKQKFEVFSDMNTMIIFMAGCAIRERMALIDQYKMHIEMGSTAAKSLLEHEEKIVNDYCRVIALSEATSPDDVQRKFEFYQSWAADL